MMAPHMETTTALPTSDTSSTNSTTSCVLDPFVIEKFTKYFNAMLEPKSTTDINREVRNVNVASTNLYVASCKSLHNLTGQC